MDERANLPASVGRLCAHAKAHGWQVETFRVQGTPADARGPLTKTTREPVVREGGAVELTPTGRPRMREVVSDEPLVVDLISVRLRRAHQCAVATWLDGTFDGGYLRHTKMSSAELRRYLAEPLG